MEIHGMPEQFWVVSKPSPTSELVDLCLACTFDELLFRGRGELHEDDIAGIYADEDEATEAAMQLLGKCSVRPQDAVFVEVVVNVMVQPNNEDMTAKELGRVSWRYHDNCGALQTHVDLAPGESVTHVEHWSLHKGVRIAAPTDAELDRVLGPVVP